MTRMLKRLLLILSIFAFILSEPMAQDSFEHDDFDASFAYDDIPVLVLLEGYPNFYIDVIYANNDKLYVNIQELFYALGITCNAGPNRNSFEGFFGDNGQEYLIDFTEKYAQVGSRDYNLRNRILKENGTLYLVSDYFAEIFGIHLKFNYRTLSLILTAEFELPIIKQQRLKALRENMTKVSGEMLVDTAIGREYHMFKPGVIDWSIASYQSLDGQINNRVGFGLGAEIFHGEANIALEYNDQYEFTNRQVNYHWRWVDNDKELIKQAQLGRISNQTIAYINSPLIGAVIRNSPTTIRKAKGYHTISDYTEPDWTVELYINNVLSDYTTADPSGLYTFKIPLVYGYTTIKLKFYGPMGEERSEERSINMPYTVMAKNKFEYSLSAGLVQDTLLSRFGKADFNYGVNNFLTVGAGVEYLSSISSGNYIPYAQFTMQPIGKLTLFGEYAHGVRARGLLSYYFKSNALLEIDYTRYVKGQRATFFNALEERKLKLSLPFRFNSFAGYSRFEITEMVYEAFSYYQTSAMLSAHLRKISANSIFQFNWINQNSPFITTELNLSYRLGKGYTIRPSVKYNITEDQLLIYKIALEKNIPRGNFSASYEKNALFNDDLINFTFRYDLSFAKTSASISHTKGKLFTSETAQGSLAFGSGNNYVQKSNNSSLSKGGVALYPFLDLNHNGIFDEGEQQVKINSVRAMGGRIYITDKDSIIRISNFNSFTKCIVEFNDTDLENIAWRFKHKKFEITIDPNQFKRIDVPILSVGEVSGMAYRNINNSLKGIGRILINIYKKDGNEKVAETLSEYDGYINYLGLEPGDYIAKVDSVQLRRLGFIQIPSQVPFSIKKLVDGDIVEGLDFTLSSVDEEIAYMPESKEDKPDAFFEDKITTVYDTLIHASLDTIYKVQLLALEKPLKGNTLFSKLLADIPGLTIEEKLGEDGLYHYSTVMNFKGKADAREFQRKIKESGWKDSFVTVYAGEKRADKAFILRLAKMGIKIDQKKPTIPPKKYVVKKEIAEKVIEKAIKQQILPTIEVRKITNEDLVEKISLIRDSVVLIPNDTLYKIHLLALRVPIRVKGYFTQLQTEVPGITVEETLGENGLYQYSTGAIRGMNQARELMQLIKQSGWKTCFLVTYTVEDDNEPIYKLKRSKSP